MSESESLDEGFGLIVVGDEILNARRRDRHFEGIGTILRQRGLSLLWFRILPDDPAYLTSELRKTMTDGGPVFCCGGIGATPDDHTRACAAAAAGVPLQRHPGAVAEIESRFGADAYPVRIRMADLPAGADLIPNPYNRIPGFAINRHYFMPGFPDMAHPMAEWVLQNWYPRAVVPEQQRSVLARGITETPLMAMMEQLTRAYPEHKFFSLPRLLPEKSVELGFRGRGDLTPAFESLQRALLEQGVSFDVVGEPDG